MVGASLLPAVLLAARAQATLMRGLPLRALCNQSRHIVRARALAARCSSSPIGGRAMIVTETRLRVEEALSKLAPSGSEITVRTLGGVLDGVGELVQGQAELSLDRSCLLFLTQAADGALWVTGMAQGHYPLTAGGPEPTLAASPHLPALRDFAHSAVRGLVGQSLSQARAVIARESAP